MDIEVGGNTARFISFGKDKAPEPSILIIRPVIYMKRNEKTNAS